nr:MAG TPA: hypothetical protein [Caudoviricetes sp.]
MSNQCFIINTSSLSIAILHYLIKVLLKLRIHLKNPTIIKSIFRIRHCLNRYMPLLN